VNVPGFSLAAAATVMLRLAVLVDAALVPAPVAVVRLE
jgi:hypothetical protein